MKLCPLPSLLLIYSSIAQSENKIIEPLTHWILGNFSCYCRLLIFFKINFLKKILSGLPSECQTVWTLIRPSLIWVQTVRQGYRQTTLVDKELTAPHRRSTNSVIFAPSDESDQPRHSPNLIRIFDVRMKKA